MASTAISGLAPSSRQKINAFQASFFIRLIDELAAEESAAGRGPFRDLGAYSRFLEGAYACGFVCRDFLPEAFHWEVFLTNPDAVLSAPFKHVRQFVHYMLRAERHADAGFENGGGMVFEALRSGALSKISRRLSVEISTAWSG
ncbi:hypothetical protein [Muricoccus pecuniae]|uniref:Uncharacterized protein n=1 Tax=Muricoccus pecuniae TaxID=693023 RepID=A0A840YEH3_9PROT|nr:hypothetical protein [Roseomonas pecuniae]MBB5694591.1 hypothetical protein [Roseomonas pecuniae]